MPVPAAQTGQTRMTGAIGLSGRPCPAGARARIRMPGLASMTQGGTSTCQESTGTSRPSPTTGLTHPGRATPDAATARRCGSATTDPPAGTAAARRAATASHDPDRDRVRRMAPASPRPETATASRRPRTATGRPRRKPSAARRPAARATTTHRTRPPNDAPGPAAGLAAAATRARSCLASSHPPAGLDSRRPGSGAHLRRVAGLAPPRTSARRPGGSGTLPPPQAGIAVPGAGRPAPESVSIVRSSGVMAAGTLGSRLTGFLRTIVQSYALGAVGIGLAYNLSNTLPNAVYYVAIGGVLTSVIVPLIVSAAKRDRGRGGYDQRMFTLVTFALAGITLVAELLAVPLVHLYAGSKVSHAPATLHLTMIFALFFIPQIFFYGMSSLMGAILNSRGSFAAPMWTPIVNNVVVIGMLGMYVAVAGSGHLAFLDKHPGHLSSGDVWLLGLGT